MHTLTPLLVLVCGCKAVPEAPGEFTALTPYLFEHGWDEDTAALGGGLDQLSLWLGDYLDEAQDGYQVDPLSQQGFNAVDEVERTTEGMVGLAMAARSEHSVRASAWALVSVDQDEIFPKTFDAYARTWEEGDGECFASMACDRAQCVEDLSSSFAMGLKSTSTARNQYVWVETEAGEAMVHRNWQLAPPEVNSSLLEVDQQAYLDVFLPKAEGAYRLQAQWTVYSADNGTPEDMASQLVISFLQDMHDDLEAWLGEHDSPY